MAKLADQHSIMRGLAGVAVLILLLASDSSVAQADDSVRETSGTPIQIAPGTVARVAPDNANDVVSVKAFGASCGSDDTTAINAAIATGKGVYFPACTYTWRGNTSVPAGTRIYGDGQEKTVLQLRAGSNTPGFTLTNVDHVQFSDMTISGAGAGTVGAAIRATGTSSDLTFNNVRITNWFNAIGGSGVGTNWKILSSQIDNNRFDAIQLVGVKKVEIGRSKVFSNGSDNPGGGRHGIGILAIKGADELNVHDSEVYDNYQANIAVIGSNFATVTANHLLNSRFGSGIQINGGTDAVISDNTSTGNAVSGIDCTMKSSRCKVSNNTSTGNLRVGVEIDSESDFSIVTGNVLSGNGWEGASIYRSINTTVVGNQVCDNGGGVFDGSKHWFGIHVWDTAKAPNGRPSNNTKIEGNTLCDNKQTPTQHYGVGFEDQYGHSVGAVVNSNRFYGNSVAPVLYSSANLSQANGNSGFSPHP